MVVVLLANVARGWILTGAQAGRRVLRTSGRRVVVQVAVTALVDETREWPGIGHGMYLHYMKD